MSVVASLGHGRHTARVVRLEGGALALVYKLLPQAYEWPELHQLPGGQSEQLCALARPAESPTVPAGHGTGLAEPSGQ